jgi:hypothetical protein
MIKNFRDGTNLTPSEAGKFHNEVTEQALNQESSIHRRFNDIHYCSSVPI